MLWKGPCHGSRFVLVVLASRLFCNRCDCPPHCTTPKELLWQRFFNAEYGDNDIGQHASTLRLYASRVSSVTEMGVQWGLSTWALLQGLSESLINGPKVHRAFDIVRFPHEEDAKALAASANIDYTFVNDNVLAVDIQQTDLLFIDTFHAYPHLKAELRRHAEKARKYIIMHDTTVDANVSECARLEEGFPAMRCELIANDLGFSPSEVRVGLWPAIQEFLSAHHEWQMIHRYTHNNGLTILERRSDPMWRPIECDLNLTSRAMSSIDDSVSMVVLRPENIFKEYERLVAEVAKQQSAWSFVRLGILLAFFWAPLQHHDIEAEAISQARRHIKAAIDLDPAQPHARLAYAHTFCPYWQEGLRTDDAPRAACSEMGAATSEQHFRRIAEELDLWEAHLALAMFSLSRGAMDEARESQAKVNSPALHPLPLGELYWESVLCHAWLA